MPEGKGYGPQDQFSGSSPALNVIGSHIYGISGAKQYDDNETTFIESTTGKFYADVFVQFNVGAYSADDPLVQIYFNGIVVLGSSHTTTQDVKFPFRLLIPPLTNVKITATNQDSTALTGYVSVKGRIYK